MKNPSQHSPETIARMKANSEAARKRLAHLNAEYRIRQQAQKNTPPAAKHETFSEAITRTAKESNVVL